MAENNIAAIKKFLATEEKPLGNTEFLEFWKSLSEEEQAHYKQADLS